jgi:hypothetical protein
MVFSTQDLGTLSTSLNQIFPAGRTACPDARLYEVTMIFELVNAESPIVYSFGEK